MLKTAIIDIGSNSVRLMMWADGKSLYKKISTTRLAEGISRRAVLSDAAMERTANAIRLFAEEARGAGASVYAFATAAVRSAENGKAFCARVKSLCGVDIEIVSGEEEAHLGLFGALGMRDGGIIDIGGASTEVCFREGGITQFSVSLPVGCVRLFDRCADDRALLEKEIEAVIEPLGQAVPTGSVYAIGGTASTLASVRAGISKYDPNALQELALSQKWLEECADRLLSMNCEQRKEIAGMDPHRADIIAGGALLLCEILKKLNLSEVKFSDRDNLEGYLYARGLS